jgi:GNAT superfamily N-acetyltransferase
VALGLRLLVDRRRLPGPERPARVPDGSFGVLVLAVDPPARRRGVGKALLAAAADEARAAGFAAMHLTTYPGSDAARFYASQGWTALLEPDGSWEGLMTRSLAEVPGGQVPDEGTIDEPQTP